MKFFTLLGIALALASSGYAQAVLPPGQAKKIVPAPAPDLAAIRANVDQAKNLAKGHRVADAEEALTKLNHAKPNTAAWHLETAQRLMQTAEQLARDGQPASVPALAANALSHLTQAESLARNAAERGQVKTLAGFIYERYLADPASAVASYEAAAQLAPAGAGMAQEAAERLRRTDDNARAKSANGRKLGEQHP